MHRLGMSVGSLSLRSRICFLTVLLFALCERGLAQEYRGTILGQVTDQTGAVIPNATVTAIGPQQTYRAITEKNGQFNIPFVQLGSYNVTAEATGFGKLTKSDIRIDVSAKINLTFSLKAGGASETVTVSDTLVGLNTADASGGTVLDPEKVQNLPLNGRQIYMMLSLTPGTKFTQTAFGPAGNSGTRGWDESNSYSINGQSGNYNQFTLNGAPVSRQGGGGAGTWNIAPNVDAVDEFKVMTNTYDASYGRVGGGTINTVLKSGSDNFHGTVFEYWRNSVFDANYYQYNQQGASRPFHNQHQFGGTVGGPIFKKKTYFFGSFEGWREVLPVTVVASTLTSDMFPRSDGSVDLSSYVAYRGLKGIYDPASTRCADSTCQNYTRTVFPGNVIPANRVSKVGLNIMKVFPSPNRAGYDSNFVANDPGSYKYNQPIVRIDHNFTDATRMYGMFAWWSGKEYRNGSGLPGAAAQGDINNYRSSLTQVIDVTHTFRPNLFGDFRVSFNRSWDEDPNGRVAAGLSKLDASDLGLNMPAVPTTTHRYAPEITMNDCCIANVIGSTANPSIFETYTLSPSITHTIRNHNLHYGADFMLFHDVPTGIGSPNGAFSFGSTYTQQNPRQGNNDGAAVADLLLGFPDDGHVDYYESVYVSYNDYSAYLQDDWKVLHNLTLNLGLRWEKENSPHDRNNRLNAGFCSTCVNPVSSQINGSGITLPNGSRFPSTVYGGPQFASGSLSAYKNYLGTFSPKFGFSYGLSPRLVMRGGWGTSQSLGIELGAQSTWQAATAYVASLDNGLTPSTYFNTGTPYPNGIVVPAGNTQGLLSGIGNSIEYDQRERKIPIVQQYSFGFQGELPWQIIWDLEYVGSHAYHLRSGRYMDALNPTDFDKGHNDHNYLDQAIPNPFYGVLNSSTSVGSTSTRTARSFMAPFPQYNYVYNYTVPQGYNHYNSLIAKIEKRFTNGGTLSKGLSFLSSFTWSQTLGATGRLNNSAKSLVDDKPYKALSSSDRPWDFAFSGLYGLPVGKGGAFAGNVHGVANILISDWQLSWIFSNDGGQALTYSNSGGYINHMIYGCGQYNPLPQHRSWSSYVNNSDPSCFQTFPEYTRVTGKPVVAGIRKPWAQQTQLGLQKKFPIREGLNLQFKAEAFNLTNTPIFDGPSMSNPNQKITRKASVADANQPGAWSGFGTIGSTQQNFPRQLQLSLKILF